MERNFVKVVALVHEDEGGGVVDGAGAGNAPGTAYANVIAGPTV